MYSKELLSKRKDLAADIARMIHDMMTMPEDWHYKSDSICGKEYSKESLRQRDLLAKKIYEITNR